MMGYVSKTVDVDIDLDDLLEELDDDELLNELERRGLDMNTRYVDGDEMRHLLTSIWLKRRLGVDYQQELDQMIYYGLGKVL